MSAYLLNYQLALLVAVAASVFARCAATSAEPLSTTAAFLEQKPLGCFVVDPALQLQVPHAITHPYQMGVFSSQLFGNLTDASGTPQTVTVVSYVKVFVERNWQSEVTLFFTGKSTVMTNRVDTSRVLFAEPIIMGSALTASKPRFYFQPARRLRPVGDPVYCSITAVPPPRATPIPFSFSATVDRSDPQVRDIWFGVEQFGAFQVPVPLDIMRVTARVARGEGPLSIYTVLAPPYHFDTRFLAHLLDLYKRQHVQHLGFNSTIMYVRGNYMAKLLADEHIQGQLLSGVLRFMIWDQSTSALPYLYNAGQAEYMRWDQDIIYGHAAVAFSGANTYLMYSDYDEFVITPQQGLTVREMLAPGGCLDKLPIRLYDIQRIKGDKCGPEAGLPLSKLTTEQLSCVEEHLSEEVKTYKRAEEGSMVGPMAAKVLAFADDVFYMEMHKGWGYPPEGGVQPASVPAPRQCIAVLLTMNRFE